MNPFTWIWQYVKPYTPRLIIASIFLILNAVLVVINPFLSGILIDEVIGQNQPERLGKILLLMIGITFFRTVVRYTYQMLYEKSGQDAVFTLRNELYDKLNKMDFNFFNHTKVGDIMARMTGDTDAIRHFVSWVSYNIVECIVWFLAAVIVMAYISWPLMLALVAVTPFIYLLARSMTQKSMPRFLDIRESFARLNSMVEENISGNRVVKAFVREDYEIEKFNRHNEDFKQKNMASAKVTRDHLPTLDFLANSLSVITLIFGGYLVIKDQMSIGDLVAFNGFLWMLNNPMRMSGWLINDVQRFQASSIKIMDMLNYEPAIPVDNVSELPRLKGDIRFEHVNFEFADDPNTPVLKDISFEIKSGQTLGILGETGSGKSTLVNLISRFYDPTKGTVYIDGKDARDYSVRLLRNNISMVMQDIFLFSDTISENIAFGNPSVNQLFIREMARIADADTFINKMPDGYNTIVGERGVGLSGGQKQRISLARALVKDPSILILDDTTSAVDMETEAKIQEELTKITSEKTTIIIAHRISSVRDADLILMMAKGRVVEQGTHAELVAKRGLYYDVYQKQLGIEGVAPTQSEL